MKPKLQSSSRAAIEKYKISRKRKVEKRPPTKSSPENEENQIVESVENALQFTMDSEESDDNRDLSRQSSLRSSTSSLLGEDTTTSPDPHHTENPLDAEDTEKVKPDVVVTKPDKVAAFLHLVPAPIPTR